MTTSDRLDCAQRTLDSWSRVRGVSEALFVFSCEPCDPMLALVTSVDFAPILVSPSPRQLGNEANSWRAMNLSFGTGAGFVIQAEDDVIVAEDVLEYLSWAWDEYASDESVLSVTAFQNARRGGPGEVFRRQWFTPQVWGMWRRSWDLVCDRWPGGPTPHSWDWYLCQEMQRTAAVQIEPCWTRVQHIGVTGAHGSHPEHLAREWEAQRFEAAILPQEYREIPAPVPAA